MPFTFVSNWSGFSGWKRYFEGHGFITVDSLFMFQVPKPSTRPAVSARPDRRTTSHIYQFAEQTLR